jgi:hypothetical protein
MSALGDENVGRFDVAGNDASSVSGIERVGDFDSEQEKSLRFLRPPRNAVLRSL